MKDRPLEVTKHFDCAEELVQVIGQSRLRVAFLRVREQVDLRLLALRLGRETGVDIEEAVSYEPYYRGTYCKKY